MVEHPRLSAAKRFGRKWKRPLVISAIVLLAIAISLYYNLLPAEYGLANGAGLIGWGIYILIERMWGKEKNPTLNELKEVEAHGQRVKHEYEEASKEKEKLRAYLKGHYENDVLPAMHSWLERPPPVLSPFDGPKINYAVLNLGVAYYYSPPSRVETHELDIPDNLKDAAEEVKSHLGLADWGKWESLKNETNSLLERVVKIWREIETDIQTKAKELGLDEWNGTYGPFWQSTKPKNYYWMYRLVYGIWIDPEFVERQNKHIWDEEGEGITEAEDSFHKIKVWQFGNTSAQSLKKETLEDLKRWLPTESDKVAIQKKLLPDEMTKVESDVADFQAIQRKVEYDYTTKHLDVAGVGISSLPNSCSICKHWLDELKELGA